MIWHRLAGPLQGEHICDRVSQIGNRWGQGAKAWSLVAAQQETNKQLVETNQELILRLGRIHERLERLERLIHDGPLDLKRQEGVGNRE